MDSATTISAARLHIVAGPLTGPEVQAESYGSMPAGGVDTFGCDFTADSGSASIYEMAWTASFDPGSTGASDPDPQSRILGAWATDEVDVRSTIDGTISTISGQFSVVMIGGFPQSAIGGTYRLVASASLTDNRVPGIEIQSADGGLREEAAARAADGAGPDVWWTNAGSIGPAHHLTHAH